MGKNVVAERYAQALFEVGEKHGQSEEFYGTLALMLQYMDDYPDFRRLLNNPLIRPPAKKEMVLQLMSGSASTLYLNFVQMVIDNRREQFFPQIRDHFARLFNQSRRRVQAQVTTAVAIKPEVSDELKKQLEQYLKQEVILEKVVDPRILGGAVLQLGDQILDGSIRGRLHAMEQSLN